MSLENRSVLVTGGSQGFGRAIVEELLGQGASVTFCARTAEDVRRTVGELDSPRVNGVVCDISRREEAEALVTRAIRDWGRLDALVNNAGIYGPIGPVEEISLDDWERAMHVNVFGVLYLCRAVIPHFKERRSGKIVNISGGGATNPMPRFSAYAASKAAMVRLSETLAEELKPFSVDVNSVAPGALRTRLMEQVIEAGPDLAGEAFFQKNRKWVDEGATPPELGARLCAYLVSSESDGITGRLISAQWDPWERLGELNAEMAGTDIYTLRRIVAEDRGKKWSK